MKNWYFFLLFIAAFVSSCDKKEDIPAYIRIEPFEVQTFEGSSNHEITEGWIFVNNDFLGAYKLPGEVPVLQNGPADISISPGIKENGIANTPTIYYPLTAYTSSVTLEPGITTTVTPTTKYDDRIEFPTGGTEDFEGGGITPFEDADGDSTTFLTIQGGGPFDSHLVLNVDEDNPENSVNTTIPLEDLPKTGGQQVWVELHHKNDVTFSFFLFGLTANAIDAQPIQVYQFNQNEEWNKIYLNITDFVTLGAFDRYQLAFRCVLPRDINGDYVQETGTVQIDNIKVLYFKQ